MHREGSPAITPLATRPIGRLIEALSPCVLDIGARGGADEAALAIAWASRIVCFEPDAGEADQLRRRGDARWRDYVVLPIAVGGTTGSQPLHVPAGAEAASLLPHDPAVAERFGTDHLHIERQALPVETWTLDDLQRAGHFDRVDYLKLDVEGAELAVLRAAAATLQEVVALKVECSFLPQHLAQPLVWDVARFLLDAGFELVDIQEVHRWRRRVLPAHPYRARSPMAYSRGQVAQCDLVFLRAAPAVTTDEQALRLLIAGAALGFFDYGVTVLRGRPDLAARVQREYGFDLEGELRAWSAVSGRDTAWRAFTRGARTLVPLFRSWVAGLPAPPEGRPY